MHHSMSFESPNLCKGRKRKRVTHTHVHTHTEEQTEKKWNEVETRNTRKLFCALSTKKTEGCHDRRQRRLRKRLKIRQEIEITKKV